MKWIKIKTTKYSEDFLPIENYIWAVSFVYSKDKLLKIGIYVRSIRSPFRKIEADMGMEFYPADFAPIYFYHYMGIREDAATDKHQLGKKLQDKLEKFLKEQETIFDMSKEAEAILNQEAQKIRERTRQKEHGKGVKILASTEDARKKEP